MVIHLFWLSKTEVQTSSTENHMSGNWGTVTAGGLHYSVVLIILVSQYRGYPGGIQTIGPPSGSIAVCGSSTIPTISLLSI